MALPLVFGESLLKPLRENFQTRRHIKNQQHSQRQTVSPAYVSPLTVQHNHHQDVEEDKSGDEEFLYVTYF